jgi:hypothetical protein
MIRVTVFENRLLFRNYRVEVCGENRSSIAWNITYMPASFQCCGAAATVTTFSIIEVVRDTRQFSYSGLPSEYIEFGTKFYRAALARRNFLTCMHRLSLWCCLSVLGIPIKTLQTSST